MSRIIFAVVIFIMRKAVMTVFSAIGHLISQIVAVCTVTMHNFAEHTLPCHIQAHKLTLTVAAVFKEEKGCSCFLVRLHQIKALLQIVGSANLHCSKNTLLHSFNGDFNVPLPRGGNNNSIKRFQFENFFIITCLKRRIKSCVSNCFAGIFRSVIICITDCNNLHIVHFQHWLDKLHTTLT